MNAMNRQMALDILVGISLVLFVVIPWVIGLCNVVAFVIWNLY